MSQLTSFLMQQENDRLAAGDMSAMRHKSPEGGLDTVGFGHKLTQAEQDSGLIGGKAIDTLTMEDAHSLLQQDIQRKRVTLNQRLQAEHGISLKALPLRKQEMLLDYEYNLGDAVGKFPSFTQGVLDGDENVQKDEFMRNFTDAKGVKKPLARNAAFYKTFMSPEGKAAFGE